MKKPSKNHQHLQQLRCVRTLRQAVEWGARPIDLAHDYNWLGAKGVPVVGRDLGPGDSQLDSHIIPPLKNVYQMVVI